MKCKLCGKKFETTKGLSIHLKSKHNFSKEDFKNYYDKYLKKENEGKCIYCGEEAIFFNLTRGYHRICKSSICLGKTRSSMTFECYMNKYNISEEEAKIMQKEAIENRLKSLKIEGDKRLEKNPDHYKERSQHCIEYWIKRGYSEKEAKLKIDETNKNFIKKGVETRMKNPENYKDIYKTQKGYWLKRGYTEEEALLKVKERQTTFSLDICIEKYGEVDGKKRWLERQHLWNTNYKKNNFSKISQKLFWSIYELLENKSDIYFATLKNGVLDDSGCNNELRLKLSCDVVSPDFIDVSQKKIIEFDGIYYHRNTPENAKRSKDRDDMLKFDNYLVLHINEKDYKENKEKVIKECIEFLKN